MRGGGKPENAPAEATIGSPNVGRIVEPLCAGSLWGRGSAARCSLGRGHRTHRPRSAGDQGAPHAMGRRRRGREPSPCVRTPATTGAPVRMGVIDDSFATLAAGSPCGESASLYPIVFGAQQAGAHPPTRSDGLRRWPTPARRARRPPFSVVVAGHTVEASEVLIYDNEISTDTSRHLSPRRATGRRFATVNLVGSALTPLTHHLQRQVER